MKDAGHVLFEPFVIPGVTTFHESSKAIKVE